MKKLNLGCGKTILKGFINGDIEKPADLLMDLNKYPYKFKTNSIDYILASHVIEHLESPEKFLTEMRRILREGGILEIKVPHYKDKSAYCCFSHRGFYHERAVESICNSDNENNNLPRFKHVETIVKRGRFLFWQKREITWILQKYDFSNHRMFRCNKCTKFLDSNNVEGSIKRPYCKRCFKQLFGEGYDKYSKFMGWEE